MSDPASSPTAPQLFPEPASAPPFTDLELRGAMRNPAAAIDMLLAQRQRWMASVLENRGWARMVVLLLTSTVLFSLPYGFVLSSRQAWHIAILFLGPVAICLPSLHVVSAYLGLRVHIAQSLSLATIIAAVASIFSFSFAPILWFLQVTSSDTSARETVARLSALLLGIAAVAGMVHGTRCLTMARRVDEGFGFGFGLVLVLWQVLLFFIGLRMSTALGLR
jgi:hypothetical protein